MCVVQAGAVGQNYFVTGTWYAGSNPARQIAGSLVGRAHKKESARFSPCF